MNHDSLICLKSYGSPDFCVNEYVHVTRYRWDESPLDPISVLILPLSNDDDSIIVIENSKQLVESFTNECQ